MLANKSAKTTNMNRLRSSKGRLLPAWVQLNTNSSIIELVLITVKISKSKLVIRMSNIYSNNSKNSFVKTFKAVETTQMGRSILEHPPLRTSIGLNNMRILIDRRPTFRKSCLEYSFLRVATLRIRVTMQNLWWTLNENSNTLKIANRTLRVSRYNVASKVLAWHHSFT